MDVKIAKNYCKKNNLSNDKKTLVMAKILTLNDLMWK